METMRFRETKKTSYKGHIFFIVLFLLIGAGITYIAIKNEKEPTLIGQAQSDIATSANLDGTTTDALANVDNPPVGDVSKLYKITNKTISDKSNPKIKANVTLPVISINNQPLTTVNDEIFKKFNDTYQAFKQTMANAGNKFTYTVTYKVYDNTISNKNIVSITLYERMIDDSAKTNSMEKICAYNINLKDGSVLSQDDIVVDILGPTYKDQIKNQIKNYVLSKHMMNESEYNYSYTGLEVFYIKDNKLHLIFNPDELANKKYSILDISI